MNDEAFEKWWRGRSKGAICRFFLAGRDDFREAWHAAVEAEQDACAKPDRTEEYRRIWIERAAKVFEQEAYPEDYLKAVVQAFDMADAFVAELKRRDGNA